jgi:hypothetical protein
MAKTRINPAEETVLINTRQPRSVKEWLAKEPGGISKTIRRLVKEERWRREGKHTEVENG